MLIYVHNLIVFSIVLKLTMGGVLSWFTTYFQNEKFVAVLGLDGAGKTALVHHLMFGEAIEPLPTIGFYIHNVLVNNMVMQVVDVCGSGFDSGIWSHMYHSADGIIYVVDSTDKERLQLAFTTLDSVMLYPTMEGKPFVILMNKQDGDGVSASDVKHMVEPGFWRVFDVSVKTGEGIDEAMVWFASNLS